MKNIISSVKNASFKTRVITVWSIFLLTVIIGYTLY